MLSEGRENPQTCLVASRIYTIKNITNRDVQDVQDKDLKSQY